MEKGILNWSANRTMKDLGVDEAAQADFQREQKESCVCVDGIVITENWLYANTGLSKILLPLRQAESLQKTYVSRRYDVSFYVEIIFAGDKKYRLRCEWDYLDEVTDELKRRCPQARQIPNERF